MSLSTESATEKARALMARKDSIEAEIASQISILQVNGCDMKSSLVDAEGFPRADIDIYAVRNARVRVIELRNDLKAVMDDIGRALEGVYAQPTTNGSRAEPESALVAFARVADVSPNSPASEAGLLQDDLIVKFGKVTSEDCSSGIQPIAKVVSDSEGKVVVIKVLRDGKPQFLSLSPRPGWGGRGMLGCHVVPAFSS